MPLPALPASENPFFPWVLQLSAPALVLSPRQNPAWAARNPIPGEEISARPRPQRSPPSIPAPSLNSFAGFSPQTRRIHPKPAGFSPETRRIRPKLARFSPQTCRTFTPNLQGFDPKPAGFTPNPQDSPPSSGSVSVPSSWGDFGILPIPSGSSGTLQKRGKGSQGGPGGCRASGSLNPPGKSEIWGNLGSFFPAPSRDKSPAGSQHPPLNREGRCDPKIQNFGVCVVFFQALPR